MARLKSFQSESETLLLEPEQDSASEETSTVEPETQAEPEVQTGPLTVRMTRESNVGPLTADVHPDEVQNFTLGGWRTV